MPQEMENYLARMRQSRRSPSVLKIRLAMLRSAYPDLLIFAFEGNSDKSVYYQWIKRLRPELQYEPFPCDGKGQVFELQDMLERDRGNLGSRIFFFVDRDFDDLRGRPTRADTFMTDCYSVENYLVTDCVLEELLKDEFHCHGQPIVRSRILEVFQRVNSEFLSAAQMLNFRLFVARRLSVPLIKHLPDTINAVASVSLLEATEVRTSGELIVYKYDVDELYVLDLKLQFEELRPVARYRGKFALLFFMKWLNCLAEDRGSETPKCFSDVDKNRKINVSQISIGMLASKSEVPRDFPAFIAAI